jgi:hypothetical protein
MVDTRRLRLQFVDALAYALVMTTLVFGIGASVALLVGIGPLVGAKWFMFVVGFAMLAYSSLKLRPTALWKDDTPPKREPVGVQAAVPRVLPANYRLPVDERISVGAKLMLSSISILVASFVMEVVFGVAFGA